MGGRLRKVSFSTKSFFHPLMDGYSIYYQHDPDRISACPVTIHALLHIADSIAVTGPVWCYWAFPMEHYCGALQPAIQSCCFPYALLDCYITENAQLTQIKVVYNVLEELALCPPCNSIQGSYKDPSCMCATYFPRIQLHTNWCSSIMQRPFMCAATASYED
jgi:hypothetical protein